MSQGAPVSPTHLKLILFIGPTLNWGGSVLEMPTRVNCVPGVHDKMPPNDRYRHAPFKF